MLSRGYLSSLRALFSQRQLGEPSRSRTKRNRIRRHGGTERLEDRTLLTAPYSANDSYSVAAGGVLTVPANGVLANDVDMDGNTLTAQLYMPAPMGTVTLNSNGSFVYTAPSAFTGTVPFYYRAFDGSEFGNMATVNITVTTGGSSGGGGGSSNQPPVPTADSFFVEQNTSGAKLPVLWNDTDPNSNPLSITTVTTPAHGTASPQFDSYTNKSVVSYTPTSGYTGSDNFNYTISDGSLTASATDTLTIHAVDNTIAQARPLTLTNNVRLATGGIIGDGPQSWSDVDIFFVSLTAGQVITFDLDSASIDSGGSYGSFNGLLRLFSSGGTQVASNDNGTDPDTNASGNDPYLSYTVTTSGTYYLGVSDSSNATYNPTTSGGGYGMQSGAYVLQVLRSVPNQPPVATSDSASTHHETAVNIPVLSNDSDPNGDSLALTSAGTASHGTTQIVTIGGVSQIRYTPTTGFVGTDSFTYSISDPSGATDSTTASVEVTNVNPFAFADSYAAVAGVTFSVAADGVLENDADADSDSLTANLVTGVSHGTLTLNSDGSFSYAATSGFSGTDSFVYRAFDGARNSANTTVTLNVYASHVIAAGDAYSVGHDKTLTVAASGLLANDWSYQNLPLTAVLVTSPTHGVLTLNSNGSFVYVPDSGYVGADSFSYRATNGTQQSSIITVPLSVTNFAPWAVNDLYTVRHDRISTRTAANGVLRNDVDIEDDTLTVSLVAGTAHGTLSLNSNGSFSFDPDAGYTGTTSFTYRVSDGFNLSQIATASIQVLNNAPNAGEDWFYTPAGQSLVISAADLKSNDVDADNDALTLSVSASPVHGTLTVQPNGDFLYQPNVAWSGTDTFTYTVTDGLATSAPTTVSIKVSNTAPIGVSDFYNVRHDRPLVVTTNSVVANDIDDDDDVLSVILHTAPATGTLVLNSDGTFVYTPEPGATGDVTFKYRVTDGIVTSAPVTATIRITNESPVGRTDSFQIHQGDTLSVSAANGVLKNDTDADNDALVVSLHASPSDGTLSLNGNGSFSYTPDAGFSGTDSFSYRVTDGLVTSAPVVVSISVSNSAPVANSNTYTVVHDRIRTVAVGNGVLANDFDVDADSLTAVLVTGPSHGTLQLQANGSFTYSPASNYTGVDSFVYKAFDGSEYSDSETVTLTVTNNRPWTVYRSFAAAHDHSIAIAAPGLLAYSGDRDSDVLSIVGGLNPTHGSVVLNPDGSFVYTPDAGFVGADTFGYRVSDGLLESAEAIVTIRVFNRLPVARTDYFSISHDRPLIVSAVSGVLQNDSDLDDDNLTVTLVAGEGPEHGTLSLQSNGSFTYTPAGGFVGTDSFRYRISDGAQSAEGTANLLVQNSRPVADNDKYGAVVGQTLNVSAATGVLFNDVDADLDALQAVLVSGTTHGTLSLAANGSFNYTPDEGFLGVDTFRYQAKDTVNTLSFVKTVSISTALVAGHDELEVSHDRVLSGDLTGNDHSVPGTAPVYSLVTGAVNGTLSLGTNGTFTYTPVADFVGEATFTYRFAVNGHYSNTATATISVVNEAPLLFTGTWRASHGKTITATSANGLAFRSRDRDGDDLTFVIVTQPTHGTMTLNAATGAFTYIPSSNSYTGPDSFQWRAHDGITWSAIKTGYIELLNRKASLSPDSYQIHSGQTLSISAAKGLLGNDFDSDGDSLQPSITVQPAHGVVTLNGNGSFVYVPSAGVINADDSFKYKVYDGAEWSAEATVTVKVSNSLPSTRPEQFSVRHDKILTVPVSRGILTNDYDSDGDPLSAIPATQPLHGTLTLSANGAFTYQPDAGYVGTDSFAYRAHDGFQQSGLVTVSLTVTNVLPVAGADQFITRRNGPMTFTLADLKGNDSDADGDALTILPFSIPSQGSLSSNNGVWTYTPDAGFVGIDEFTYRVTDGVANSNLATVSIEVLNSAPVAAGDRFELPHDQAFSVGAGILKTNDFDIENDTLTTSLVTNVRNGTLSLQSNGAFIYTPNAGFIGRDSFRYRLSDGNLNSKPVRVILDVVNNRPTTNDAWYRLTHDTVFTKPASSGLLSRAKDSDGDNLTASIVANVRNGTLSVTAAGGWIYTPNAGFVGTDSFSYRVSDGSLQSTAKTVRLEVGNTPVVASMDAYTTAPNTTLTVAAPGVLQNDSDVDDDTLVLTVVDNVLHGTLTLQQNGSFVYVPTAGFIGQDTFTYKVSDGIEDTTASVTLTVTGIPQSGLTIPVSRSDFYSSSHSTPLTVSRSAGVLSNDRDPNNDNLTAQLVAGPSHGTLTLNANGSFSYQPFAGNATTAPFVGTDSFTYRVTDGSHLSAVTSAQIKVTNSLPWAANAAFETHQGQSIPVAIGQLSRHAGDNDQDSLIFSLVTNPANGSVTLNSNGTFSYTPDAGYSDTDTFIYRVRDAVGNSNNATVSIDVVNERPTAFDLEFSTTHGEVFNGSGRGVLAGASDQDNDPLTAHLVSNASHGTVVLNSDGTFTYTPVAGYAGDDNFIFKVRDGAAFSYNALVRLTVDNQKPVANDAFQSTQHDQPVVISLTAFDSDGDDLTYELVAAPQHGTLTYENLINNGSNGQPLRFTGRVTYQPTSGFSGEDTFRYRVNDGVTFSDDAEVALSIRNLKPRAADSMQRTTPGQPVVVTGAGLLATASDPDGDQLTLQIVTQPTHGTLTLVQSGGVYTGGYTYTPNAGYAGNDSFRWRVSDGADVSDTVAVSLTVQNNAPTIADHVVRQRYREASVNGSGQRTYTVDLAASGISVDADKDALQYQIVTNGQHGTATLSSAGLLKWTSTSNTWTGNDKVIVRVTDGFSYSENAEININIDNTQPTAAGDFYSVHHNQTLTLTPEKLRGNDFDFDGDTLQIVSVTNGEDGTLTQSGNNWVFNPGTFIGTTELTYIVSDGLVNSEPATIEIEVTNAPVWGVDRSFTLIESTYIEFELSGTAGSVVSADGDATTISIAAQPSHGSLTSLGDNRWRYTPTPASSSGYNGSGNGTTTVTRGYLGHDQITFRISDGIVQSNPVTYSFNVIDAMALAEVNGLRDTSITASTVPVLLQTPDLSSGQNPIPAPQLPEANAKIHTVRPGGTATGQLVVPTGATMEFWNGTSWVDVTASSTAIALTGGSLVTISPDGNYSVTGSTAPKGSRSEARFRITKNSLTTESRVAIVSNNSAPILASPFLTTAGGSLVSFVRDAEGDSISFTEHPGQPDVMTMSSTTLTIHPNGTYVFSYNDAAPHSEMMPFQFTVRDQFGASTTGTLNVLKLIPKSYVAPIPPAGQTDPPVAGDSSGPFLAPAHPVSWLQASDGGHPSMTFELIGDGKGTYGAVRIENRTVYYTPYGLTVGAFLKQGAEPTTFYYKVTNAIGSWDIGSINIEATTIGGGEIAQFSGSYAVSYYDEVKVAFDTPYGSWFDGDLAANVFIDMPYMYNNDEPAYFQGNVTNKLRFEVRGDILSPIKVSGNADIVSWGGAIEQPVFAGSIRRLIATAGEYVAAFSDSYVEAASQRYTGGQQQELGIETGTIVAAEIGWVSWTVLGNAELVRWKAPIIGTSLINSVLANGSLENLITSGGNINCVRADLELKSTIQAGGTIGFGEVLPDYSRSIPEYWVSSRTVFGGSVNSLITAGSHINNVRSTAGDIESIILAGGNIGVVNAEGGKVDSYVGALGRINQVAATDGIDGVIAALLSIGQVWTQASITATVLAGTGINTVEAWNNISGSIRALAGPIRLVSAGKKDSYGHAATGGSISSSVIYAGKSIGSVIARKVINTQGVAPGGSIQVAGGITAGGGYIGQVSAGESVAATVTAVDDIGSVVAGSSITGSIQSKYGSVITVSTTTEQISGQIKAKLNIGTVTAGTDRIGATTAETGSIQSVVATQGRIQGDIKAQNTLGTISAGTDISGNITAVTGSMSEVLAGLFLPGNIDGNVSAGGSIGKIDAKGLLPADVPTLQIAAVEEALRLIADARRRGDADAAEAIIIPELPKLSASIRGDILGNITASNYIGSVTADGGLSGSQIVADFVNGVWAYEDIAASILSRLGSTAVTTWGVLEGAVTAQRSAQIFAYEDVEGKVLSKHGAATVQTLGQLNADVVGYHVADVQAFKDINGDVISPAGFASAKSTESINATISSVFQTIGAARKGIQGDLLAKGGNISALSAWFSGTMSNLVGSTEVDSGFTSSFAERSFDFPITPRVALSGDITAFFESSHDSDGEISSLGYIDLGGFANLNFGDIKAVKDVTIRGWGDLSTGRVTSDLGGIAVEAYEVSGVFKTGTEIFRSALLGTSTEVSGIRIVAWKGFKGSVSSKQEATIQVREAADIGESTAARTLTISSGRGITGKSANGDKGVTIAANYNLKIDQITSRSTIKVTTLGTLEAKILAKGAPLRETLDRKPEQNVIVFAGESATVSVESGADTEIETIGRFTGSVRAGGGIRLTSWNDSTAYLWADQMEIREKTPQVDKPHNVVVSVFGKLTSGGPSATGAAEGPTPPGMMADGSIVVLAYGDVKGAFVAGMNVTMAVTVSGGSAEEPLPSGFEGVVIANGEIEMKVAGDVKIAAIGRSGITLNAHGSITESTATLDGDGKVTMTADNQINGLNVSKADSVSVIAIEGIESLTISDSGHVEVDSHANATVTLTSTDDAEIRVRDTATVTGTKLIESLYIVSTAGSITLNVSDSSATVISRALNEFGGTVTTNGNIDIATGVALKGTLTGAEIILVSLKDMNVQATGQKNVDAYATVKLAGKLESKEGEVHASSIGLSPDGTGGISAELLAKADVRAWSLGSISGKVESTAGNVVLEAASDIAGIVTSFGDVNVTTLTSTTATITGGGTVDVTAFGSIKDTVKSTNGSVDVLAGGDIDAKIEAKKDIDARTFTGNINKRIDSENGKVILVAGGSIKGAVEALGCVDVYAIRDISGELKSLGSFVDAYSLGGGITGAIDSHEQAIVSALSDVSGKIKAIGDVKVNTWGSVTGGVEAGRDAKIVAGGNITGSVEAHRDAFLDATGNVHTTLVKAATGDVDIEAWGGFKQQATAPAGMVSIWTGAAVQEAVITAHETVSIYSYGNVDANATSSAEMYVFGNGNVKGIFNATTLVDVASLKSLDAQVTTGGKAEIYSLENAKVVGDADSGFTIVTDGALEVDATSLDGDVITWSLEQTTGTIDAGQYADSVSWGATTLKTKGTEGAYVWSYGILNGEINSSSGYAIGISLQDNNADFDSETWTAALAGGNVTGIVFSFGSALAFAGGDITAITVAAVDMDAAALAFGKISTDVTGGRYAVAVAAGNISGLVDGGEMAIAFAGQNLDARVTSDKTVALALAGGNVSGAITAGETVQDVFAYGSISSNISAGTPGGSLGIVETVEAIGPISGSIVATTSIGTVRSGAAVTATLTAPVKPVPVENDSNVAIENPALDPWDSGIDAIRTQMATRRAEWVTKRNEAVSKRDEDLEQFQSERTAELDRVTTGRTSRGDEADGEALNRGLKLSLAKSAYLKELDKLHDNAVNNDGDLKKQFRDDLAAGGTARREAILAAETAFNASWEDYLKAKQDRDKESDDVSTRQTEVAQTLKKGEEAFADEKPTITKKMLDQGRTAFWSSPLGQLINAPSTIHDTIYGTLERGKQFHNAATELQLNGLETAIFVGRYWFAEHVGIVGLYKYWEGVDPLTDRDLRDSTRMQEGVFGAISLIGSAVSIMGVGKMVAGKIASTGTKCPGGKCFVGDTQIIIGQHDSGPVLPQHLPIETGNNSAFAVLCLIVGAMSGIAVLRDEKRSKRLTAARPPRLETMPDHVNDGTDLAFSDPVDLLQGVPETTTGPVDRNSKDGLVPGNRPIADSTSERTSESDVSSVLTASGTNSVGKSVRTSTLKAIAVVSLLLSAWFGLNRPAIDSAAMSPAVAEMTAELAVQSPRWDSVAIREIQPAGYKVLADNPQTPGQAPSDFGSFDPNKWQVHRFLMTKPNGGWLKIGLARPVAWIESVERNDSAQIWLEFEELGIADWATLQGTEPCPSDILGEGRLVTGTFEHSSGEVLNLFIAGEANPIGSTANHPFWSEDRQDFVQAGSLNPGEHLRLADGRTTTLERTEPIAEQLPVYNLEVDGEHVYFVGESGVLVHNAGDVYFKINEGVRRAKAAEMAGKTHIRARVFDRDGKFLYEADIEISKLGSPKSHIRLATDADRSRWSRINQGTADPQGSLPPIELQAAPKNAVKYLTKIRDVLFDEGGLLND